MSTGWRPAAAARYAGRGAALASRRTSTPPLSIDKLSTQPCTGRLPSGTAWEYSQRLEDRHAHREDAADLRLAGRQAEV